MDTSPTEQATNLIAPAADLASQLWQRYVTKPGVTSPVLASRLPLLSRLQGRQWPSGVPPAAQPGVRYIWRQKRTPSLSDTAAFASIDHAAPQQPVPQIVAPTATIAPRIARVGISPAIQAKPLASPIDQPALAANEPPGQSADTSLVAVQAERSNQASAVVIAPASTSIASDASLASVTADHSRSSVIARAPDPAFVQRAADTNIAHQLKARLIPAGQIRSVTTNQPRSTLPLESKPDSDTTALHSIPTFVGSTLRQRPLASVTTALPIAAGDPAAVVVQRQAGLSNVESLTRQAQTVSRSVVSPSIITDRSNQVAPGTDVATTTRLHRTVSPALPVASLPAMPTFLASRLTDKEPMIDRVQRELGEPSPDLVQRVVSNRTTIDQSLVSRERTLTHDLPVQLDAPPKPVGGQRFAADKPPAIQRATDVTTQSAAGPQPAMSPPSDQSHRASTSSAAAGSDLTRLADEVYALLEQRLTIERERLGR